MQINRISTYTNQNPNFDGNLQVKSTTCIKNISSGSEIVKTKDLLIDPSKIESIAKVGNNIVAITKRNIYEILNQGSVFENFVKALRASLDRDLTIFDSNNRTTSYRAFLNSELEEIDKW